MTEKYWALVDLRYPAGDAEYAKAVKGLVYEQVVVKAGEPLLNVPEQTIKSYLSMGRDVITSDPPKVESRAKSAFLKVEKADEEKEVRA